MRLDIFSAVFSRTFIGEVQVYIDTKHNTKMLTKLAFLFTLLTFASTTVMQRRLDRLSETINSAQRELVSVKTNFDF